MVEVNELRIGNLVTDEFYHSFNTLIIVESINDKGINLSIEDDGNWSELAQHFIVPEYVFTELFGVPIDENWLLKLGFKKTIGNWDFCNRMSALNVNARFFTNMCYFEIGGIYIGEIKYVHRLQNIWHSLSNGQEILNK